MTGLRLGPASQPSSSLQKKKERKSIFQLPVGEAILTPPLFSRENVLSVTLLMRSSALRNQVLSEPRPVHSTGSQGGALSNQTAVIHPVCNNTTITFPPPPPPPTPQQHNHELPEEGGGWGEGGEAGVV